jgi:hypothetical protein
MASAALIAILLAAFLVALGVIQVLCRLINSHAIDRWVGEPPDASGGTRRLS